MEVGSLSLPEVLLISPQVHQDERGRFVETWNEARFLNAGLNARFCQDNVSFSRRDVLRGLHCQHPHGQGKLVTVLRGRVFDVAVDIRVGSPRFGKWDGVMLDDVDLKQLFVPPGFLHGFVALTDDAVFSYKCTEWYDPSAEFSVHWDDPTIGIRWPIASPLVSARDAAAPLLAAVPTGRLPVYSPVAIP